MWKTKLCLAAHYDSPNVCEQIKLYREVGFEGFFTCYDDKLSVYREQAEKCGMYYQSVHAPYVRMNLLWRDALETEDAKNELIKCIDDSADAGVPIVVAHTYIGMGERKTDVPNELGISNFSAAVERAVKRNIKIAFENTEGEEFLAALMNHFKDVPNVGFCWDTGHEMCYNYGEDMMALYGDRLIATHLNDNLGIRDFDGNITFHDDLHLFPFDGIADWDNIAMRMAKYGYNGELTFELNRNSKPGRYDNDKYREMTMERYVTEAYARACKVAAAFRMQNAKCKMQNY